MEEYRIFCNEGQTKRAFKLGAPIETDYITFPYDKEVADGVYEKSSKEEYYATYGKFLTPLIEEEEDVYIQGYNPTVEQMLGWLRDKGVFISYTIGELNGKLYYYFHLSLRRDNGKLKWKRTSSGFDTYEEAIVSAIDCALDILEKKSKKEGQNENDCD